MIKLEGATAIAQYDAGFYAGRPAITRHAFGQGAAYYVGTRAELAGMDWLLNRVCEEAQVRPAYAVPEGVDVVRRDGAGNSLLYVLNHRPTAVDIVLDEPVDDLISGRRFTGVCTLEPYGVAILGRERRLS